MRAFDVGANEPPEQLLAKANQILAINNLARQRIDQLWELRGKLSRAINEPDSRASAAIFLKTISAWVDFSGRLRFATRQQIATTAKRLPRPLVSRLIESAQQNRVGIVAPALAFVLVEPPPRSNAVAFDNRTRMQLLQLIKSTHEIDATAAIYELLRWPHTPATLQIQLIDTLREIGASQSPQDDGVYVLPKRCCGN